VPVITFKMGPDTYGFRIARVKEVVRHLPMTRIPKAPDYMPGIINLRGGVVTVVDLALRFGLAPVADPAEAFVIVVEVDHQDVRHLVGLMVDFVHEVLMVDPDQIDGSPKVGGLVASDYVDSIFLQDGTFVSILNLEKAFDLADLERRGQTDPEGSAPAEGPPP
jgi:purine-binding chemotaxis protein CheW